MVINTNIAAQTGARLLGESTNSLNKSLARLSSGLKIVSPEDDAAGLAVSSRFDAQINRVAAVSTNVSNAISFSQTQEGYLKKIAKALDRMSELSVMAQDVTKSTADVDLYETEFTAQAEFINDLATKEFNGIGLLDGTDRDVVVDSEGATFTMTGVDGSAYDLTGSTAAGGLTAVTDMIDTVATDRATVGANISVLGSYNDQLAVLKDNLTAANSRIKDVDVAEESTNFAKQNILVQAGTAMLAQANATTQSALRLLQ
ncbi:MAG: flagellin [Verrucomicrobiota bacterium]